MEGPGGQMSAMSVMSESAPTTRCDSPAPLTPLPGHGRSKRSTIFSSPSPCASRIKRSSLVQHRANCANLVKPPCCSG